MICREVTERAELESIQRLRFEVYVEEMGRRQRHADPARRSLAEPLDATAIHLAAFADGGDLVGALRLNLSERGGLEAFETLYGLAPNALGPRAMVITRLVARPDARGGAGSAGLRLARTAHRVALETSVERVYIDCGRALVPFFEWLGFDPLRCFEHVEYGEIAVMQSDPRDRARLVKSGSPLLEVLDDWDATARPGASP